MGKGGIKSVQREQQKKKKTSREKLRDLTKKKNKTEIKSANPYKGVSAEKIRSEQKCDCD